MSDNNEETKETSETPKDDTKPTTEREIVEIRSLEPQVVTRNLGVSGKEKQREYFVKIFAFFFAIVGVILLIISVYGPDEAIRTASMDFFKLWLGALISIVSTIVTYYFKD